MTLEPGFANGTTSVLLVVSPEPTGRFTAKVAAIPEIHATSTTREEAIQKVRTQLSEWLASGNVVSVPVPVVNPWLQLAGHAAPNALEEQEYLQELARRREDLDRTLREQEEDDRQCSSSSSTPTT